MNRLFIICAGFLLLSLYSSPLKAAEKEKYDQLVTDYQNTDSILSTERNQRLNSLQSTIHAKRFLLKKKLKTISGEIRTVTIQTNEQQAQLFQYKKEVTQKEGLIKENKNTSAALSTRQSDLQNQKDVISRNIAQRQKIFADNEANQKQWWIKGAVALLILSIVIFIVLLFNARVSKKLNKRLESARVHLKNSQKLLISQEALATTGEVTAGVAHEIQNPLNFINNFSDVSKELMEDYMDTIVLEERIEILNSIRSNIEKVNDHGKRAVGILSNMMESSTKEISQIEVKKLLHEAVNLSVYGSGREVKKIKIVEEYDSTLASCSGNRSDLLRVFINILNNAIYALNEKRVTASADWKPELKIKSEVKSDHVYVSISDNGPGIPQKVLDKIFMPFYSTKPAGKGTGLGLSMSRDIIEKHHGTISVNSLPNTGTSFYILLPF